MQTDDSTPSLSGSVARGAAWLAGARLLVRGIGLVSTIVLARLLLPEDFGLVALATALLFVLETLSDLRFEQALIAQRDTRDVDLNTAWTLNLLRGLGVALLLVIIAYPYAALMDDARLAGLLLWLALIPLLDGLKNPAFVTFEKALQFRREFALQLAQKLVAFAVTVALALLWRSYWALLAGLLSGTLVRVAASYWMHPYRPRPQLAGWRRLIGFSGWLMGSNVVAAILQKYEFFLIGAFVPVRIVGLFHVGSEIANMASNELTLPLKRALYPALSSLAAEPERQYESFRRAIEIVAAVTLPIGIGLSLVAEPMVLLVLGERWLESATIIAFIAPAASLRAIAGVCDTLTLSRGNTRLLFLREMFKAGYVLPVFAIAISLGGLTAFLYAAVGVAALNIVVNLFLIRKQTGMMLFAPLAGSWRSVVSSAVMAFAVEQTNMLFNYGESPTAVVLPLIACIAAGCLSYVAAHFALWAISGRPAGPEGHVLRLLGVARH